MKHSAKKIYSGCYHYRGWEIERIEDHWNLKPVGSDEWTDATQTLTDAKAFVDDLHTQ